MCVKERYIGDEQINIRQKAVYPYFNHFVSMFFCLLLHTHFTVFFNVKNKRKAEEYSTPLLSDVSMAPSRD